MMAESGQERFVMQEGFRALLQDTPDLLLSGGDSRLQIDRGSGVSRYGCASYPQPQVVPLGSCSASTVSRLGFHVAATAHRWLREVGPGSANEAALEAVYRRIRMELRSLLTFNQVPDVEVVITPSGTDAELVALALIAGSSRDAVSNIVLGPNEIGGGSFQAAGGLYFDIGVPNVSAKFLTRIPNTPVDQQLADRTSVLPIDLRNMDGTLRSPEEIDEDAVAIVNGEAARGNLVILHRVAHSKTGLFAPSDSVIQKLQHRHGSRLWILADFAQGRVSRQTVVTALGRGQVVIVTGSKFFGGPPFSGALLVPRPLHPNETGLFRFPIRFSDFLTSACLPDHWQSLRDNLPVAGNPGLALRWLAALAEMRRYFGHPEPRCLSVVSQFAGIATARLLASKKIQLHEVIAPLPAPASTMRLENLTSVLAFSLRFPADIERDVQSTHLDRICYSLHLNQNQLRVFQTSNPPQPLREGTHVGRPVRLSPMTLPARDALRIAIGAPLISDLIECHNHGTQGGRSMVWLDNHLGQLVESLGEQMDAISDEIRRQPSLASRRRAA